MTVYRRLIQLRLWRRFYPATTLACVALALAISTLTIQPFGIAFAQPAAADWLARLRRPAANVSALDAASARLKTFVPAGSGPVLAATVNQDGHWTFVNVRGEAFTAASADELKRAVGTLVPAAGAAGTGAAAGQAGPLTLLLTEDAVFNHHKWLKDLPKGADLRMVVHDDVLRLHQRWPATSGASQTAAMPTMLAEIRPNLLVGASNRAQFDEAVWQLNRPLKTANIRVLSLEPGGPPTLTLAPKLDPATRRPLVDRLDPLRVADGIKVLRGQTALVIGRIDGRLLFVRGSSGAEHGVIFADLVQAAEASDVNLVVLQSTSARQPGARNWLWQTATVAGLDDALARAQLSDLLAVLGTGERPLAITPTRPPPGADPTSPADDGGRDPGQVPGRIMLTAAPDAPPSMLQTVPPLARATEVIGGALDDVMSNLTGRVAVTHARLYLQSRQRTEELQGRWLPSVPTGWIEGYLGLLLSGLLSWRWTSPWWQRVWPQEARRDYAGVPGFRAAQAARALLMALLFLPLAGVFALPAFLLWRFTPSRTRQTAVVHPHAPAPPGVTR